MTRSLRAFVGAEPDSLRDDRVLPITRVVGGIIAPVLLVAFLILYGFPGETTELFAWTIRPDMTPMVMGAGYGAGVYFFYRVVTTEEWHRVAAVFPGIAVFTWFMAIATLLHWENFNHEHVTTVFWAFLYVVSPFLVPGIWVLNRRTDPRHLTESDRRTPRTVRWIAVVSGVVITATAVVLFVRPGVMIETWPWTVSPLTSRILLGWFALLGTVNIAVAADHRWSAARILLHSQVLGLALVLLGAARSWSDFDSGSPYTWAVIGGMAVYLLALLALYGMMETR